MNTRTKSTKKNSTRIIGLKELREHMEKYIAEVEKGKTFLIMKKSKPAFKMVPVDEWGDEGIWKTVADFAHLPGGGLPGDEFLRMIREAKKKHNGSAK